MSRDTATSGNWNVTQRPCSRRLLSPVLRTSVIHAVDGSYADRDVPNRACYSETADVAYWHKAEVPPASRDFRCWHITDISPMDGDFPLPHPFDIGMVNRNKF